MFKKALTLFLTLSSFVSMKSLGAESDNSVMGGGLTNLNMPRGVTEVSQVAYDVHMLMMWICTAIGVVVFGFMFYVMYAHRKSRGVEAANFHEHLGVEILWTVVPALILSLIHI